MNETKTEKENKKEIATLDTKNWKLVGMIKIILANEAHPENFTLRTAQYHRRGKPNQPHSEGTSLGWAAGVAHRGPAHGSPCLHELRAGLRGCGAVLHRASPPAWLEKA